jgi:hypothetical protein
VDLGPDDYDLPGYFGDKRWSYFRLNNRSHNTTTPGDMLQDPKAISPIIAFSDSGTRPFAVADLTPAYPQAARRILRGVAMLDGSRVLVQDEYTGLKPGIPVRWAMMTGSDIKVSADGRTALLSKAGRQLRADALVPDGCRFETTSARPPTSRENPNDGFSMLTVESPPSAAASDLRVVVVFTPEGDKWPKDRVPYVTPIADWR